MIHSNQNESCGEKFSKENVCVQSIKTHRVSCIYWYLWVFYFG